MIRSKISVAEALVGIQNAIKCRDFAEATEIGSTSEIPLNLSSSEVRRIKQIFEGSESSIWISSYKEREVILKKSKITTSDDLERFKKEILILSSINHPNIIRPLGASALPPDYYLILPKGIATLHAYVHEYGLLKSNFNLILIFSLQIARAVAEIHRLNIIHRDIKPLNIVINANNNLELIDFGLAVVSCASFPNENTSDADKLSRDLGLINSLPLTSMQRGKIGGPSGGFRKRVMVGTMEYMAPELFLRCEASTASDVYALAVTMNELATSCIPFSDCLRDCPDLHTILEMNYNRHDLASGIAAHLLRPTLSLSNAFESNDLDVGRIQWAVAKFNELITACWNQTPSLRPSSSAVVDGLEDILRYLDCESVSCVSKDKIFASLQPLDANCRSTSSSSFTAQGEQEDAIAVIRISKSSEQMLNNDSSILLIDTVTTLPRNQPGSVSDSVDYSSDHCRTSCAIDATDCFWKNEYSKVIKENKLLFPFSADVVKSATQAAHQWLLELAQEESTLAENHAQPFPSSISYGAFEALGPRDTMEDRHVIISPFAGFERAHLFGVFDGHRGHQAAEFCSKNIETALLFALAHRLKPSAALQATIDMLEEGFEQYRTHTQRNEAGKRNCNLNFKESFPGTTFTAALLIGERLYVSNLGDTKCVSRHLETFTELTESHNTSNPMEIKNLQDQGCSLFKSFDSWRIGPVGLQVTRSIGNQDIKKKYGCPNTKAFHKCIKLQDTDKYLLLATDGLWDYLSLMDIDKIITDTVKQPLMVTKRLAVEALSRQGNDNITILIAFLTQTSTLERIF